MESPLRQTSKRKHTFSSPSTFYDPQTKEYKGSVSLEIQVESNQNDDVCRFDDSETGEHETQESEGGEADLHKYLNSCNKNPGHRQFIPIDTFKFKHLPEGHRDSVLYKYIKVVADLTVRVDVKMTSPDRPKFWPKTTRPYPFYKSNTRNLRTGSGILASVNKFQDGVEQGRYYIGDSKYTKCWCRQCEHSDTPSNVWWELLVITATHVVFDDIEANLTSLRLFYDRDDSPVVIVDKVSVDYVNIEFDRCILKCVTCDKSLGQKMKKIWSHYMDVWRKAWSKYFNSRDRHRLTFIVSHPHGCSKQVSVGQWKDKYLVEKYERMFTYTTCTCPGSSGATVLCMGYNRWWSELVHSGSLKSGLNYSGTACV